MAKDKPVPEAPKDIDLRADEPSEPVAPPPRAPSDVPANATRPSQLKLTPAEWAAKKGHTRPADKRLPQSTAEVDWRFAIADKLYGWAERAYHFQSKEDAFVLSEFDYLAALDAASKHPTVALHAPALTPEAAARLRGFEPKKTTRKENR